jgi:hypothetical protein
MKVITHELWFKQKLGQRSNKRSGYSLGAIYIDPSEEHLSYLAKVGFDGIKAVKGSGVVNVSSFEELELEMSQKSVQEKILLDLASMLGLRTANTSLRNIPLSESRASKSKLLNKLRVTNIALPPTDQDLSKIAPVHVISEIIIDYRDLGPEILGPSGFNHPAFEQLENVGAFFAYSVFINNLDALGKEGGNSGRTEDNNIVVIDVGEADLRHVLKHKYIPKYKQDGFAAKYNSIDYDSLTDTQKQQANITFAILFSMTNEDIEYLILRDGAFAHDQYQRPLMSKHDSQKLIDRFLSQQVQIGTVYKDEIIEGLIQSPGINSPEKYDTLLQALPIIIDESTERDLDHNYYPEDESLEQVTITSKVVRLPELVISSPQWRQNEFSTFNITPLTISDDNDGVPILQTTPLIISDDNDGVPILQTTPLSPTNSIATTDVLDSDISLLSAPVSNSSSNYSLSSVNSNFDGVDEAYWPLSYVISQANCLDADNKAKYVHKALSKVINSLDSKVGTNQQNEISGYIRGLVVYMTEQNIGLKAREVKNAIAASKYIDCEITRLDLIKSLLVNFEENVDNQTVERTNHVMRTKQAKFYSSRILPSSWVGGGKVGNGLEDLLKESDTLRNDFRTIIDREMQGVRNNILIKIQESPHLNALQRVDNQTHSNTRQLSR